MPAAGARAAAEWRVGLKCRGQDWWMAVLTHYCCVLQVGGAFRERAARGAGAGAMT